MRYRVVAILFFVLFCMFRTFAQSAQYQLVPQSGSATSSAYVRSSDGAQVTDNKVFEFADVLRDDGTGYIRLLLLKSIRNEHIGGREGIRGRLRIQAWTLGKGDSRKQRWEFQAEGNEGQALYGDRFFRVVQWGCCDWPHVDTYYSLLSGRKLYVSNSNLLSICSTQGGPSAARYVSFGYYDTAEPPLLQFGTDTNVTHRIAVLSPHEYYEPPELILMANGGVLLKSGEVRDSVVLDQPYTFTIVLRYTDGAEIRVPVQNGILKPEGASFPQGYSLRTVNLETR